MEHMNKNGSRKGLNRKSENEDIEKGFVKFFEKNLFFLQIFLKNRTSS